MSENDKTEFLDVATGDVHTDGLYQRPLNASYAKRIARVWDGNASGVVILSRRRDGLLFVIDGQHRVEAARLAGESSVRSLVLSGLSVQEEAEIWRRCNVKRKPATSAQKYRTAIACGEPGALHLEAVLKHFGIGVASSLRELDGVSVQAIGLLLGKFSMSQEQTWIVAIYCACHAWGRDDYARLDASVLRGISQFAARYRVHDNFDVGRLIATLSERAAGDWISAAELVAKGQGWSSLTVEKRKAILRLFVDRVNHRRVATRRLPDPADADWRGPTGNPDWGALDDIVNLRFPPGLALE